MFSNSSSVRPAHRGWARKAASMVAKNSCMDSLSFSGFGIVFENVVMKFFMVFTNSVAEGCLMRSRKSCHVRVVVDETGGSVFSISFIWLIIRG